MKIHFFVQCSPLKVFQNCQRFTSWSVYNCFSPVSRRFTVYERKQVLSSDNFCIETWVTKNTGSETEKWKVKAKPSMSSVTSQIGSNNSVSNCGVKNSRTAGFQGFNLF